MNIADRIQNLRKTKGLSQEQLADAVGVSRQAISKWESEQNVPDIDKIIALSDYFNVTTDYILNGIERPDEEKKVNWEKTLPIVATCLNYVGFIIMLFDAFFTWNMRPFAMTNGMVISKIVSVVFMVLGTTVFYLVLDNNKYEKIRKFLMINIFSYSIIVSMIIYFLDIPYLWRVISYIIVVFITEVILIKKRR